MKIYIVLLFVLPISKQLCAQYSLSDAQLHKDQYFFSNFTSYKINKRLGIFMFGSLDRDQYDIAPGILLSSNPAGGLKKYWELGIGGGATLSRNTSAKPYWYAQMYGWFETKPDQQLSKGKIISQCSPSFTFNSDDPWWMLGYVTYAATKNIAVGVHFQSESAKGIRLEYNIAAGKHGIIRWYTVLGSGALGGMSYIFQK